MIELLIQHGNKLYQPSLLDGVQLTRERFGSASQLSFKILAEFEVSEGDAVRVRVDDKNAFFGFIFTIDYTEEVFSIKAYDQLRYLKNKEFYNYKNKRADEVIKMIASDFRLQVGEVDTTSYTIPSRIENNTTLFDMISYALSCEEMHSNKMFVLYDDFGKLTLKEVSKLEVPIVIDKSSCESISTTSSIDLKTFNKIKVKDSQGNVYIAQDSANMNKWGILTDVQNLVQGENGKTKADTLLKLYNKPRKTLKLNNCFGDIRVRGGSLIRVQLAENITPEMVLVERVTHTFENDNHTMTLTVRGGEHNG